MFGKVPVNKCFNDLFGVRIILEYPMSFSAILSFVEDAYHGKYKCIDSSNLDYKAVHVYFKENNDFFQWELQVWNRCDVSANLSSHKKYKQRYTTVEQENEKGGLF